MPNNIYSIQLVNSETILSIKTKDTVVQSYVLAFKRKEDAQHIINKIQHTKPSIAMTENLVVLKIPSEKTNTWQYSNAVKSHVLIDLYEYCNDNNKEIFIVEAIVYKNDPITLCGNVYKPTNEKMTNYGFIMKHIFAKCIKV